MKKKDIKVGDIVLREDIEGKVTAMAGIEHVYVQFEGFNAEEVQPKSILTKKKD